METRSSSGTTFMESEPPGTYNPWIQFQSFSSKRNRTSTEKFGTGIYMAQGYSYRLDKILKRDVGMASYRCTDVKCHGRAKIHLEKGMGEVISMHNHEPSETEAQVRLARDALEVAARSSAADADPDTVKATVDAIRSTLSDEALAESSSSEGFQRNFQRSLDRRNPEVNKKKQTRLQMRKVEPSPVVQFESYSSKKNRTSADKFGTGIFMYDGYSYRLDKILKKNEGYASYRCIDTKCKGRARIDMTSGLGNVVLQHCHPSNPGDAQVRLARDVLEAAARGSSNEYDPTIAVETLRNSLSSEYLQPAETSIKQESEEPEWEEPKPKKFKEEPQYCDISFESVELQTSGSLAAMLQNVMATKEENGLDVNHDAGKEEMAETSLNLKQEEQDLGFNNSFTSSAPVNGLPDFSGFSQSLSYSNEDTSQENFTSQSQQDSEPEGEEIKFHPGSSKRTRVTANVGRGVFMANGYTYRRTKKLAKRPGMFTYRCIDKQCAARAYIHEETCMGKVMKEHNHEPDFADEEVRKAKDALELKGRETALNLQQRTLNKEEINKIRESMGDEALASAPTAESMVRAYQRARKRMREREQQNSITSLVSQVPLSLLSLAQASQDV
ncbi:hypothetical protein L596_010343 [Steinernema carpocapsae]|uniref:FLYWCH-type domain-containing protein n=1 Tax=Steinernema carpocapsae TaxID=34508 RepID=A0A4U5PII6_STECR|nr:hypothetical protein L596_010343 [Steinernema carpocapsae]